MKESDTELFALVRLSLTTRRAKKMAEVAIHLHKKYQKKSVTQNVTQLETAECKTDGPLSDFERKLLAENEAVIEKHITTFVYEVGRALSQISQNRLYRETHDTFERYCEERWELQRRRAYQIVDYYRICENVNDRTQREFTLRPLAPFPPETQRQIYWKAMERPPYGNLTARKIEETIDDLELSFEIFEEEKRKKKIQRKRDRKRLDILREDFFKRIHNYDKKYFIGKRSPVKLFLYLLWFQRKEEIRVKNIIEELKHFYHYEKGDAFPMLMNQKFIKDYVASPFVRDLTWIIKYLGFKIELPTFRDVLKLKPKPQPFSSA
jgi:hypothetical protein